MVEGNTWMVLVMNGDQVVVRADYLHVYDGVLSFYKTGTHTPITMFSKGGWTCYSVVPDKQEEAIDPRLLN